MNRQKLHDSTTKTASSDLQLSQPATTSALDSSLTLSRHSIGSTPDRPRGAALIIPQEECTISFARSGGNGGQNVNKVETKAVVHWNPETSNVLTLREKEKIKGACSADSAQGLTPAMKRLRQLTNSNGEVVVHDSGTRYQLSNKERALQKLSNLVSDALKEEKPRKATKPSKSQKAQRVDDKTQHGKKKASRTQNRRGDWD